MQDSLRLGRKAESFVKSIFEAADIEVSYNEDTKTRELYDLICKISSTKFTVEVKFDLMAQKTGNIAIEYYNSKSCKPSGIDVTEADLWVQVLQDGSNMTLWTTRVDRLKSFIKDNKPWKNLTSVGDNNACIYLYKEADILEVELIRLDNLCNKEITKIVRRMLK